jgi:hypothetical protein
MGLVSHPHEERVRIGFRMDGDSAHPQPPGGLDDAAGDLAAVGDQDTVEHFHPLSEFGASSPS